jgi:hypothetical protein
MALVGVHQITTHIKETEGMAHLTSTRKVYEQDGVDAEVTDYLAAMGVGEPTMTLMRKTPAASVRWLSPAELKASRLATLALDGAQPIATSGANGLSAWTFDGDPPRADVVQATIAKPIAGREVELALRYRWGGGAVEAEAIVRDSATHQPADPPSQDWSLTLSAAGDEPLKLRTAGAAPARALIPRERFCTLARGGAFAAVSPAGGFPPVELAAMDGAKTLIAEACP